MNTLTAREVEILSLVADGCPNEEIAIRLDITPNTVRAHLSNIFKRLKVHTRWHAVAVALREGEMS